MIREYFVAALFLIPYSLLLKIFLALAKDLTGFLRFKMSLKTCFLNLHDPSCTEILRAGAKV